MIPFYILLILLSLFVFYVIPRNLSWILLLFISLVFISSYNPTSLAIVITFSLINFYLGLKINENKKTTSILFVFGVLINFLPLILIKYIEFKDFGYDINIHTINFRINNVLLAIGFSFYTLQNIAYLIDIKYGEIKPNKNFFKYLLFISYFPKIISGPIEKAQDFLPQINERNQFTKEDILIGLQRVSIGLFKKIVLADRITPAIENIFDSNYMYPGLTTLLGVYLFTIELYLNFSGYTDIAIGISRLFGIKLTENFNMPLLSKNVSEFWRKWHISLISWFTNYLYYPTVFNFRNLGKLSAVLGIFLTFFLSGIWHGIGLTFLAWSILHFTYLTFELFTKNIRYSISQIIPKFIYNPISIIITFNLICFSNIFFRAQDIDTAFNIIEAIYKGKGFIPYYSHEFSAPFADGDKKEDYLNLQITLSFLFLFLFTESKLNKFIKSNKFSIVLILIILILTFMFGVFDRAERFIYLQF